MKVLAFRLLSIALFISQGQFSTNALFISLDKLHSVILGEAFSCQVCGALYNICRGPNDIGFSRECKDTKMNSCLYGSGSE